MCIRDRAKRIIIGGCDKKTKLRIINELSKDMKYGVIVAFPLIDIQTIKDLRETFKVSLRSLMV